MALYGLLLFSQRPFGHARTQIYVGSLISWRLDTAAAAAWLLLLLLLPPQCCYSLAVLIDRTANGLPRGACCLPNNSHSTTIIRPYLYLEVPAVANRDNWGKVISLFSSGQSMCTQWLFAWTLTMYVYIMCIHVSVLCLLRCEPATWFRGN